MAISRPQPFLEQVIFAENLHGQGQWEDNAKIVMSDHKVGHRHRNRTVCDKTAGYLSLSIVTIRVPKENLFFLLTSVAVQHLEHMQTLLNHKQLEAEKNVWSLRE